MRVEEREEEEIRKGWRRFGFLSLLRRFVQYLVTPTIPSLHQPLQYRRTNRNIIAAPIVPTK